MPSQSSLTSLPPQTSCGHQSATILRWINNADTSSPSTWTSSSRKRSHSAQNSDAEDSPISSRTRKRKRRSPLGEISANAMPEHDKIAPREGNRRSPRKHSPSKKVSSAPSTPSGRATVLGQALDDFDDDDDTPRAQGAFSLTPRYVPIILPLLPQLCTNHAPLYLEQAPLIYGSTIAISRPYRHPLMIVYLSTSRRRRRATATPFLNEALHPLEARPTRALNRETI